eukprot:GGOE01013981.1.p1 GENE.GGOE01013981.1~~GGOE01013981.1.p1  ORF type:complete len:191 (+),score=43.12 GGOE01013981.1:63-635(+)
MGSLAGDLSPKNFQALLKGLIALRFFPSEAARDEITEEFLLTEVFQGSTVEVASHRSTLEAVETLLGHSADHDLSPEQLEEHLACTTLSKEHTRVFVKVWARDRDRVHLAVLQVRSWSPQYAGLQWRVMTTTAPGNSSNPGHVAPVKALVSLDVRQPNGSVDTIPFQLSRPMLDEVMTALQAIQSRVAGQ